MRCTSTLSLSRSLSSVVPGTSNTPTTAARYRPSVLGSRDTPACVSRPFCACMRVSHARVGKTQKVRTHVHTHAHTYGPGQRHLADKNRIARTKRNFVTYRRRAPFTTFRTSAAAVAATTTTRTPPSLRTLFREKLPAPDRLSRLLESTSSNSHRVYLRWGFFCFRKVAIFL